MLRAQTEFVRLTQTLQRKDKELSRLRGKVMLLANTLERVRSIFNPLKDRILSISKTLRDFEKRRSDVDAKVMYDFSKNCAAELRQSVASFNEAVVAFDATLSNIVSKIT